MENVLNVNLAKVIRIVFFKKSKSLEIDVKESELKDLTEIIVEESLRVVVQGSKRGIYNLSNWSVI